MHADVEEKFAPRVVHDAHVLDRYPPLTAARDLGAYSRPRFLPVFHPRNGDDDDGKRAGRSNGLGWQCDREVS